MTQPRVRALLKALGIDPFKPGREHEQLGMAHNALYLLDRLGVKMGYDWGLR